MLLRRFWLNVRKAVLTAELLGEGRPLRNPHVESYGHRSGYFQGLESPSLVVRGTWDYKHWMLHMYSGNKDTVLHTPKFWFAYCKGKNSIQALVIWSTGSAGWNYLLWTQPRNHQIHHLQGYSGPWFYNPIVRWALYGQKVSDHKTSIGWKNAPHPGYWNNHSGILCLSSNSVSSCKLFLDPVALRAPDTL